MEKGLSGSFQTINKLGRIHAIFPRISDENFFLSPRLKVRQKYQNFISRHPRKLFSCKKTRKLFRLPEKGKSRHIIYASPSNAIFFSAFPPPHSCREGKKYIITHVEREIIGSIFGIMLRNSFQKFSFHFTRQMENAFYRLMFFFLLSLSNII